MRETKQRHWKKGLTALSTVALTTSLMVGCGTSSTPPGNTATPNTSGPGAGGKIQIDESVDFPHLDPALGYDTGSSEIVYSFYNQLVTYKPDSTDITGDLADSWTISPDGKTYTFKLKQGVKFWDGSTVTAQSFIDEFKRVLDPKVGSPGEGFLDPIVEGATAFNKGTAKDVSGLSAPDPDTLVIKLTAPQPYFLKVLAMPFFSAVEQKFIDSTGAKEFDHKPMGTGPFEMQSYDQGKQMVIVKNKTYFKQGYPKLDEIDFTFEKNEQSSALKFKQGQTAFISWNQEIDSADFLQMSSNPQYKDMLQKHTLVATYYLALNNKVAPFDNKLVRQAVNMAINKDKLVKLLNGRAQAANQILPPDMPGYEQNLPADVDYKFDPSKAKALLAQAGYPNGFKTQMLALGGDTDMKLEQSIQSDLKDIGIDVELRPLNGAPYSDASRSLKYPMEYTAWFQDFPDPSDFLDVLLNGNQIPANNWSAYNNPKVNDELAKAGVMSDGPDRIKAYQDIQNQVLADAPWVPLYTPVRYALVQPWLKGFYQHPVLQDPLQNIYIQK